MDAHPSWNADTTKREDETALAQLWLLGQPPLQEYLDFVENMSIGGSSMTRSALVDEWRAANDYYGELESTEAGIVEQADVRPLDPAMRPLAKKVKADPRYRRSFDSLPTRIAMVELDRLIIGHPFVSLHHVERLKARLGHSPSPQDLFRFCLPLDRSEAPVRMRQLGPKRFLFWSESTDFRFQEHVMLRPDQVSGYEAFGSMAGVLGLVVGYGSNFLNVIESGGRLLLHNGHHRACAARAAGLTHAPCIVQTVTRRDELKIAAARAVIEDPSFYFSAARPPLLKDFFDPKIRKVIRVPKISGMVEVSFEIKEHRTRDFSEMDESWRRPS